MSRSGARYERARRHEEPAPRRRPMALTVVGAVVLAVVAVLVGFALGRSGDDSSDVASGNSSSTTEVDDVATGTADDEEDRAEAPTEGAEPGEGNDGEDVAGDDPVAIAAPTKLEIDGLDGPALELAEAINRAAGLEYHARYEGEVVDEEGATTQLAVELWRRLPRARRDTTISGQRELRTQEFRLPAGIVGCLEVPPELDYSCFPADSGTVDPSDPVFGAVDPRAGLVIAREGEFEGTRVDCWEVESLDEPTAALCVDADGIPVVIDSGDGRLLRTVVDDAIDSSTFELPAPVEEEG